ncbi:hypothetical protein Tco_1453151 [Tanacetum coccineum]
MMCQRVYEIHVKPWVIALLRSSAYFSDAVKGVKFEVEPQEDHEFEVEPHGNVDHVAGSQKYRKEINEAAFAVAVVKKIYAHELLTFNDTVTCEVISKWKAGLKEDMVARLHVYVLSDGCRKSSKNSDDYY